MNILITICARGGSKGLKNKNIKILNGIPLIEYSIKIAKTFAFKHNCDVTLSTEDHKIKKVCSDIGLHTKYIRPIELSSDEAGKMDVINDILNFEEKNLNKKFDLILDLDVSSPLRNMNDLEKALDLLVSNKEAINIFSVNKSERNPYFNMVERNKTGFFELVKKGDFKTRQSSPQVYDLNASFYFYKRSFFNNNKLVINSKSLIYEVPHICFDIDNELDFNFMEYLIKNNKLNFNL